MAPTLARRYIFKLGANIVSVPVYLVMEALLPRALGPQVYGNYSFATNLFQQFSSFLDMGTSTCFYNSLSRNQTDTGLAAFYLRISIGVAALLLLAGSFMLLPAAGAWLMPDVPAYFGPLAAIWAFLTWFGRVLRSTNDALGVTIPSEMWRAMLSGCGVVGLWLLYVAGCLDITTLFIQQYLLLGLTAAAYWSVTYRHWKNLGIVPGLGLGSDQGSRLGREFFAYSHPLFVQALLSFGMLAAERWLLQWFDGSTQQGFFALSQKVSMACFLFVSAMTPLLMREFSIAWGKRDLPAMGSLMTRFAPLLYTLAAYFSCFTLVEGRALVEIFGGGEFMGAIVPVQIMALYPLHQAYGQMASSVFHASGRTWILRNITALECVYGLAVAWVMLAPAHLGGLNLGATGLAIKTVAVQFFTVNLYLWLVSRRLPFAYWANLRHQIVCVVVFIGLAWLASQFSAMFFADFFIIRFVISGMIYSVAVGLCCLCMPRFLGMTRTELKELARRCRIPGCKNKSV